VLIKTSLTTQPRRNCTKCCRPIHTLTNSHGMFCFLAVLDPRVGHTMDALSPLSPSSVILIDSSRGSPVHVLMLSIQAVCGLTRLRAPGIVHCIISFSRQLHCFLMVWPQYASFLALTVSNSSLFTPAKNPLFSFLCCPWNPQNLSQSFHLRGWNHFRRGSAAAVVSGVAMQVA